MVRPVRSRLLLLPLLPLCAVAAVAGACAGPASTAPERVAEPRAAAADAAVAVPPVAVSRVREALVQRHREVLRSNVRLDRQGGADAVSALRALGPGVPAVLADLLRAADPAVTELGGTFFGLLVGELDARSAVAPPLVDALRAPAAARRAFACEALGAMQWPDAMPHLRALLQDDAVVPGYANDATVAEFAGRALQQLEAAAGRR